MARTWPNLDANRVDRAGYYWNEKLLKLARLQVGEKLPKRPGRWDFIADEDAGSSSEIFSKIVADHPHHDINDFTYTVRTPVGRRLPLGDDPSRHRMRRLLTVVGFLAIGVAIGRAMVHPMVAVPIKRATARQMMSRTRPARLRGPRLVMFG